MVECKKMQETIRSTAKRTQVQDLLPAWWFATLSSTKGPAAATFEMPTAERLASDLVQFGHPVAAVASGRRRRASLAEKVLSKQSLGLAHCVCFGHSQCLV